MLSSDRIRTARRVRVLALAVAFTLAVFASRPTGAGAAPHAVIVSIDGLRPDVALRANMPALRSLRARGSFTMYAVTTDTAVTLPSHVSMLTGVPPSRHGIQYNSDPGPQDITAPLWPTLFEIAHRAGLTTAMSAGKSKFSVLAVPGTLDLCSVPERGMMAGDSAVGAIAARWIATRRPQVLFVHLAGPDRAGHEHGWGSPGQIAAVEASDRALGAVLRSLAHSHLADSTLVLVSSDHGGAATTHGGLDPRSHFIPWVAAGPGVRRGFDLTQQPELTVRTEDTFATACAWLGLSIERPVDGRAVSAIFEHGAPQK